MLSNQLRHHAAIGIILLALFRILTCSNKTNFASNDNSVPEYGTLTDSRDGRTYKTIRIGTQTWMAENLDIGICLKKDTEQTNNNVIEKYIFSDDDSTYYTYGGLYSWNEAMQYTTTEGAQGICSYGWHIPNDAEWETLGKAMNEFQVSDCDIGEPLPCCCEGKILWDLCHFLGSQTFFWSCSPYYSAYAWNSLQGKRRPEVCGYGTDSHGEEGECVRCIKD